MKTEELNNWIETEEGKRWLDEKKKPLLDKRDNLLEELAQTKKRLTDATEKGNALEEKINTYLGKLKKEMCLDCFDDYNTFKNTLIPDGELRDFVLSKIEKLAEADGGLIPDIDNKGEFSYKTADGKDFKQYYADWLKTESAKSYIANNSTGGGAKGSLNLNIGYSKYDLKKMTPQEVANKLDDPQFRDSLNNKQN